MTAPAQPKGLAGKRAVLDADGHVLGRLASHVAKRLLQGEEISIINAERVLVSGERRRVTDAYRAAWSRGSPGKGPHFPRPPDRILKRTVRGMLPHTKGRGREALGRLRVYLGTPPELAGARAQKVPDAAPTRLLATPLGKISRELGWRPVTVAAAPASGPAPAASPGGRGGKSK
ncbi:MAG: 50S ribosomal protein L13 [Halobacteria archaeon]